MVRGGYLLAKALHDKNIKNVFTLAGGFAIRHWKDLKIIKCQLLIAHMNK